MKVLVTGGGGFVGREIIKLLYEKNFEVISLKRTDSEIDFRKSIEIQECSADITNRKELENLPNLENIETVIHSAGLAHQFGKVSWEDFYNVNVLGTKNIAELAVKRSVKNFVLISSVAVYENSKKNAGKNLKIGETFECEPKSFYALSKLEAEKICQEICKRNNINLIILRLATVVGEEDKGNFLRLIKSIDKGRFLWIGKGENHKSIVYKFDVARACEKILEKKPKSGFDVYNISAEPLTVKKIVEVICETLGKKVLQVKVPPQLVRLLLKGFIKIFGSHKSKKLLETIDKWLAEDIYSAEKFNKAYNFKTKFSPEEGIRREVVWYLDQK